MWPVSPPGLRVWSPFWARRAQFRGRCDPGSTGTPVAAEGPRHVQGGRGNSVCVGAPAAGADPQQQWGPAAGQPPTQRRAVCTVASAWPRTRPLGAGTVTAGWAPTCADCVHHRACVRPQCPRPAPAPWRAPCRRALSTCSAEVLSATVTCPRVALESSPRLTPRAPCTDGCHPILHGWGWTRGGESCLREQKRCSRASPGKHAGVGRRGRKSHEELGHWAEARGP